MKCTRGSAHQMRQPQPMGALPLIGRGIGGTVTPAAKAAMPVNQVGHLGQDIRTRHVTYRLRVRVLTGCVSVSCRTSW